MLISQRRGFSTGTIGVHFLLHVLIIIESALDLTIQVGNLETFDIQVKFDSHYYYKNSLVDVWDHT
jgi:hypothetical protein